MDSKNIRKMVFSAIYLALAMVLPFLTGHIPQIGAMLSPMHIPVLLCGFTCGWQWGLLVGAVAPILRSVWFGMPPMYPTAAAMAFELAAYGAFAGLLYKKLGSKTANVYISLVASMLLGRLVWGAARFVMAGLSGSQFSFQMFLAGAFTSAIPGIILHIAIIPPIIILLKKAGLILNGD